MDQSLLIEFNKEFSNVSNLRIESLRRLLNKIIDFWENKFVKNSPVSLWGINDVILNNLWVTGLRQSPLYTHFPILILIF